VPWAESVGALEELRQEGKVRMVGVSNADPDQIRQAQAITQLASVQNELSPRFRSSEPELELCTAEGIAFLPWSPLGGIGSAADLGSAHTAFAEVARARGVSPQQVCLAWLLAKSPVVVPIPGARRVESILDSVAAAELELTPTSSRAWTPASSRRSR
jgi:aryl-alcohol dehydrogenase-like predicted oxidoreductase